MQNKITELFIVDFQNSGMLKGTGGLKKMFTKTIITKIMLLFHKPTIPVNSQHDGL